MKNTLVKHIKNGMGQAVFTALFFAYTYLPLLALGMYNHSNTDDYWMSVGVHHTLVETGSVFEAVKYGISNAIWIWKSWDGCFLSMLFTILSPAAFHEDLYCIVYPVISASMLIGAGTLAYVMLVKILKLNRWRFLAIWLMFMIIVFDFVPYYGEAYYWWPGGINYTFFFGVLMFTQAMAALYIHDNSRNALVISSVTGFCTGLGNLMTALINPLILGIEVILFVFLLKRKDRRYLIIPFLASLAGLMINVCAPGNLIRGGTDLFDNSAVAAVISAITQSTYFIRTYYKKTMTVFLIFLFMNIFEGMGKAKTDFKFKYPLVFVALSYGVYCAMWTPVTYTGVAIYARLGNQLFLGQMMLFTVNAVYLSGWIHKNILKDRFKYLQVFAIYVSMLLMVLYFHDNSYLYNSEAARVQVASGNARQFDEQVDERFKLYYDNSVKEVYVKPVEYIPGLFFYEDTSFDTLADYFYKDFIKYEDSTD